MHRDQATANNNNNRKEYSSLPVIELNKTLLRIRFAAQYGARFVKENQDLGLTNYFMSTNKGVKNALGTAGVKCIFHLFDWPVPPDELIDKFVKEDPSDDAVVLEEQDTKRSKGGGGGREQEHNKDGGDVSLEAVELAKHAVKEVVADRESQLIGSMQQMVKEAMSSTVQQAVEQTVNIQNNMWERSMRPLLRRAVVDVITGMWDKQEEARRAAARHPDIVAAAHAAHAAHVAQASLGTAMTADRPDPKQFQQPPVPPAAVTMLTINADDTTNKPTTTTSATTTTTTTATTHKHNLLNFAQEKEQKQDREANEKQKQRDKKHKQKEEEEEEEKEEEADDDDEQQQQQQQVKEKKEQEQTESEEPVKVIVSSRKHKRRSSSNSNSSSSSQGIENREPAKKVRRTKHVKEDELSGDKVVCCQVVLSAQDKGHKKHQLNIVSYYFNDEYYYCSKHLYILGTLRSIGESSMRRYLKNNIDNDDSGMVTVEGPLLAKFREAAVAKKLDDTLFKGKTPNKVKFFNVKYLRKVLGYNMSNVDEKRWWKEILDQMAAICMSSK